MGRPASLTDRYGQAGFGRTMPRGRRPALVVVDFSNGFTNPDQPTGAEMTEAIMATGRLLTRARAAALPVVFTTIAYGAAQTRVLPWLRKAPGLAALRHGSTLVELDARLEVGPDDLVVTKTGASAFFGTALATHLVSVGADTVIVTGATTSGCVRATVVDAVQYGYPVLVPREGVADRAAEPHEANLFDMHQKYADVITLGEALAYVNALVPPADTSSSPRRSSSTDAEVRP